MSFIPISDYETILYLLSQINIEWLIIFLSSVTLIIWFLEVAETLSILIRTYKNDILISNYIMIIAILIIASVL